MSQPDPAKAPRKIWPIAVTGLAIFLVGHIVNATERSSPFSKGSAGSSLIAVGLAVLVVAAIMKLRARR